MEVERNAVPMQTANIESYRYAELPWKRVPEWLAEFRAQAPAESDGYPGRERISEALPLAYRYDTASGFADEPASEAGDNASEESEHGAEFGEGSEDLRRHAASEEFFRQLLAAETAKAEERGAARGREQGLQMGREESASILQAQQDRLFAQASALSQTFAESRESYLHRLEQESAKLALAVAARILRREIQVDPLLLTGAVRVALGQLASSTEVRLRVPAQDAPLWRETMARMPGPALRPEVVAEPEMELGECRMETELGSADLGLWAQLKTLERGFFARPGELTRAADSPAETPSATVSEEAGR